MSDPEENAIKFAPPVPVTGPDGNEYFLRQSYAVISPQEGANIAKQVAAFIASALAAALGYQLVPIAPSVNAENTKPETKDG